MASWESRGIAHQARRGASGGPSGRITVLFRVISAVWRPGLRGITHRQGPEPRGFAHPRPAREPAGAPFDSGFHTPDPYASPPKRGSRTQEGRRRGITHLSFGVSHTQSSGFHPPGPRGIAHRRKCRALRGIAHRSRCLAFGGSHTTVALRDPVDGSGGSPTRPTGDRAPRPRGNGRLSPGDHTRGPPPGPCDPSGSAPFGRA